MALHDDIISARRRQQQLNEVRHYAEQEFSVSKLDEGRQHDVLQCLLAIRTSKKPAEVAAARRALRIIYQEYEDKTLRDVRRWMMREKKQGRHENVKNLYYDVVKDPKKYNPYGASRG